MRRFFLHFILAISFSLPLYAVQSPFGKVISSIIWDSPLPRRHFKQMIVVKSGGVLTRKALRRTVKLLYATGRAKQVSVTASIDSAHGVHLVIHFTPQLFIASVHISGNRHLSNKRIRSAANIHKRDPWLDEYANSVREKIVLLYQQSGYFNADVTLETTYLSSWKVRLNISVREGELRTIRNIVYKDNLYPRLARQLKRRVNLAYKREPLTDTVVEEMSDFISDILSDNGYPLANAEITRSEQESGTVTVSIDTGPKMELEIEGNHAFSTGTIRKYIMNLNRKALQEDKTQEQLLLLYHVYGFPDVDIRFSTHEYADAVFGTVRVMKCLITEGERRFITRFLFDGAKELPPALLEQRIKNMLHDNIVRQEFPQLTSLQTTLYGNKKKTFGDSVSLPSPGMTVPPEFYSRLSRFIKMVYRENGYQNAAVRSIKAVKEDKGTVIHIAIDEGVKTTIAGVDVIAKKNSLALYLKETLNLRGGVPYSSIVEKEYRDRLQNELQRLGYYYATISLKVKEGNNHTVRLIFELDNLFAVRTGVVVFHGNIRSTHWLMSRLSRLSHSDSISKKSIKEVRRNLQNTGFFDFVRISLVDAELPGQVKDVLITVRETHTGKISPGIGVSTDEGFFAFGMLSFTNMIGTGLTLKSSLKIGRKIDYFMPDSFRGRFQTGFSEWEKIDRNITVSLLMPDILFLPIQIGMQLDAFHIHLIKSNAGYPYLKQKNGMMLLFYRKFLEHYFASVGTEFFYQNEKEYGDGSRIIYIDRLLVKPQLKFQMDFRNNIFFPSHGAKFTFDLENQTSLAGKSGSFTKMEGSLAAYLPLTYQKDYSGKYIPKDRFIFHTFFDMGIILLHNGDLSIDDALKLGGNSNVRGFYTDMLFPQDNQTKSARGTFVYYIRNEFRIKLYDNLYTIAFFDMGNLWEDINNIGNGEAFRFAAGPGFAYISPIGSLNLQLGFNLNPRPYEDKFAVHAYISSQ